MSIPGFFQPALARPILLVLGLIGATGAYHTITGQYAYSQDPFGLFGLKVLYAFVGAAIGLAGGLIAAYAVSRWRLDTQSRNRLQLFFLVLAFAPITWVYFDFSEFSTSYVGLIIFWTLNVVAAGWLSVRYRDPLSRFIEILIVAFVWQIVVGWWFIAITWQHIDYWD